MASNPFVRYLEREIDKALKALDNPDSDEAIVKYLERERDKALERARTSCSFIGKSKE